MTLKRIRLERIFYGWILFTAVFAVPSWDSEAPIRSAPLSRTCRGSQGGGVNISGIVGVLYTSLALGTLVGPGAAEYVFDLPAVMSYRFLPASWSTSLPPTFGSEIGDR